MKVVNLLNKKKMIMIRNKKNKTKNHNNKKNNKKNKSLIKWMLQMMINKVKSFKRTPKS